MRDLTTIVAGFDPGDRGHDALALAELIARTVDGELLAARVRDRHGGEEGDPAGLEGEIGKLLAVSPVRWRSLELQDRSPANALRSLALDDRSIGMIAVGSTHRGPVGRVLPGGVAERLLEGAPCAVGVAPRGFGSGLLGADGERQAAERLRVIAVAYDANPESKAALALAAKIAAAAQATVRVIAVGQPYPPASAGGAVAGPTPDLQSALHEATRALPDELRALPIFEHGEAAGRLLARAEEGVDLMVMGSRGHGPLHTVLLGSTSTVVIEAAPCPTIVVPRPAIDAP